MLFYKVLFFLKTVKKIQAAKTTEIAHFRDKAVHVCINKSLPPIKCEQDKGKTVF